MATERELRRARPGWVVVTYVGCDPGPHGPRRGTAERITNHWYPSRQEAERHV